MKINKQENRKIINKDFGGNQIISPTKTVHSMIKEGSCELYEHPSPNSDFFYGMKLNDNTILDVWKSVEITNNRIMKGVK